MKLLIRLILLVWIVLCLSLSGKAQNTYIPNDSTVCTSIKNVKKTALRIQILEAEKKAAIRRAATAEVISEEQKKVINKLEHKLFWNKVWKPIKNTGLTFLGIALGYTTASLQQN